MAGNNNLENYLNSWGAEVVRNAKINLQSGGKGGGELENSIKFKVTASRSRFKIQFLMADYGTFQDKGVKGAGGEIKSGDHKGTWGGRRYYTTWEGKRKDSNFKFGNGKSSGSIYKGIESFVQKKGLPKGMVHPIVKVLWIKGMHGISFYQKSLQLGMKTFNKGVIDSLVKDIKNSLKK